MSNKESNNKQKQEKTKVEMVTECVELLRANRNIILNGAPGTGKTYLAKQIAAEMIGMTYDGENTDNDPSFKEHVRLVQFHPSYDYTDFVEGLRPYYAEDRKDGQIGFRRKNGIFKAFCNTAATQFPKKIQFTHYEYINEASVCYKENNTIQITANFGKNIRDQIYEANLTELVYFKENNYGHKEILDYYKDKTDLDNDVRSRIASVYSAIVKHPNPFVFIIDEINRGEISKIFGELFFSIDPGYRGIKGRVDTQYQNLITDDNDCFKDGFYVPENVYIIGTMNDIDRSVESMDFAFRRRFAFKEVLARDTQYMISDLGENVINRMTNLNKAITKAGFTSAYHVGASYFLKRNNDKYDFKKLWSYHLEGLLKEYLRGRDDAESILKDWERAYNTEISEA